MLLHKSIIICLAFFYDIQFISSMISDIEFVIYSKMFNDK